MFCAAAIVGAANCGGAAAAPADGAAAEAFAGFAGDAAAACVGAMTLAPDLPVSHEIPRL
jgi:hypothetical protein